MKYITREIRVCLCGCNQTYKCKANSNRKYVNREHANKNKKSPRKDKTYANNIYKFRCCCNP